MSSKVVSDILQVCHNILSEKVTERRSAAERLRELLQTERFKDSITNGSSCKQVPLTWDLLFDNVQKYVFKECESLLKLEQKSPNPTSSSISLRKRYKQDVADTFRALLKSANSQKAILKVSEVLNHVMKVLQNSKLKWLVPDYLQVLLNHVLGQLHYTEDITLAYWEDLRKTVCELYSDPEISDCYVITRIIRSILVNTVQRYDISISSWFDFFEQSIKPALHSTVLEHLLAAFNIFCIAVAPNARSRLCRLGEQLVQPLLGIWNKCSSVIKDIIIESLHIQVRLHHPNGITQEEEGAWSYDDKLWTQDLNKLCEFSLNGLHSASKRLQSSIKGDTGITPLFINFTVDVLQQVQSDWSLLPDVLINYSSSFSIVIWLQLISHLLYKSSTTIHYNILHKILTQLHNLQLEVKRSESLYWVLTTLYNLACYMSNKMIACQDKEIWNKIWSTSIKNLQYKDCNHNGCQLLITLLNLKLVENIAPEPWKVICSVNPTRNSLSLLITLLQIHKLPETLQCSVVQSIDIYNIHPYRVSMLSHLLLTYEQESLLCSINNIEDRLTVFDMSSLLISLIQPSCSYIQHVTINNIDSTFLLSLKEFENLLSLTETVYLQSSFDINPLLTKQSTSNDNTNVVATLNNEGIIDSLCTLLFELLLNHCQLLLQPVNYEILSVDKATIIPAVIEYQTYISCVVLHVVHILQVLDTTLLQEVSYLLLKQVSIALKDSMWSAMDNITLYVTVKNILKHLSSLFDILTNKTVKLSIPNELIQDIVNISLGKFDFIGRSLSVSSNFSLSTSNSKPTEDYDDFDFMDSQPSDASDNSSSHVTLHQTNLNILDPSLLNHKVLTQIDACCFVIRLSVTDAQYWNTISNIIEQEQNDLSSAKSVQLLLSTLSNCILYCLNLSQEQVTLLILSLRKLLFKFYKNSLVHERALLLFKDIVSHFQYYEQCLNILSSFWSLYKEGSLCAKIRCLLADCFVLLLSDNKICENNLNLVSRKRKRKDDNDSAISLKKALISLINDNDHTVRLHLAKSITVLFTDCISSVEQKTSFEDIKTELKKTSMIQCTLDKSSRVDEPFNYIASMLCTLQCIACTSETCEHHVISALISATAHGHIDGNLIKKVLKCIAVHLKYTNEIKMLEDIVGYLVSQWLTEGSIDTFPYQLFSSNDFKEFLMKYHKSIMPYLIQSLDSKSLDIISLKTNISQIDLIQESLATCMIPILTGYAQHDSNMLTDIYVQATEIYEFILSYVPKEVIDQCMKHCMTDFIVQLLSKLYDNNCINSSSICSNNDPVPIPPFYSSSIIQVTINYLSKHYFNASTDNIINILAQKKDSLQAIFLQLNLLIYSSHRLYHRKRLFMAYSLFASLVCQELKTGLNKTGNYIIMDIVHSVCRVLHDHVQLLPICCHTLNIVCNYTIKHFPELLGPHCHIIFSTLLPHIQSDTEHSHLAVEILQYIICNGELPGLQDHLILLDPLPDNGQISEASKSLSLLQTGGDVLHLYEEMKRFLLLRNKMKNETLPIQGLRSLHKTLQNSCSELYNYAQQNDNNIVLQLIQMLIKLIRNDTQKQDIAVTEITRCLGDIGPIKVSTIAIPVIRQSYTGDSFKQDSLVCALKVLELLTVYLTDNNIEVVHASITCIKSILNTTSGYNALLKLEKSCVDTLWYKLLEPFRATKVKKKSSPITDSTGLDHFISMVDVPSLWQPSHEWANHLTKLLSSLIRSGGVRDEVLSLIEPLCQIKSEFCEQVFSLIVYDILKNHKDYQDILSRQICQFFSNAKTKSDIPVYYIQILLDTVMYLRTVPINKKCTPWDNNFWLKLDFIDIAQVAIQCQSYFTSLLYIEIWYNNLLLNDEHICLSNYPKVQHLLLQIYNYIGEVDGYYGACVLFSPKEELTKRLDQLEGRWEELVTYSNWDATLHEQTAGHPQLIEGCKRLGHFHLLNTYLNGCGDIDNNEYTSYQHEMAWRCSIWKPTELLPNESTDYHSCINSLLVCLRNNKLNLFDKYLTAARGQIMNKLSNTSFESICNIYPELAKLKSLLDLESASLMMQSSDCSLHSLLFDWQESLLYTTDNFDIKELLLSIRLNVIHTLLYHFRDDTIKANQLKTAIIEILQTISNCAIESGQYQTAKGSIIVLKHFTKLYSFPTWTGVLEEAKLYWAQGNTTIALLILKNLIQQIETDSVLICNKYPTLLSLYGNWLAETLSDNPITILEEYLEKAVKLLENHSQHKSDLQEAYLSLARFSDTQYRRISEHMTTTIYTAKQDILQRSQMDLRSMSVSKESTPAIKRHVHQLAKHNEEDVSLMLQQEKDRRQFLTKAITNYILCLKGDDKFNLRIFRLSSLWFLHNNESSINELINEYILELPSYKFLPVIYQLAARMNSDNTDSFQIVLHKILLKLCQEHPYHSLYVILALSNAGIDNEFPTKGYITGQCNSRRSKSRKSSTATTCSVDMDKVNAANQLLNQMKSFNAKLIHDVSLLCEACVDFAYHDVTAFKHEKTIDVPSSCPLLKLKLTNVPIPTVDLSVDHSGNYTSAVTISSYDNHFTLCGGVNLPKVVSCIGSNGIKYRQLLKGCDDLRQDAVMQQVFKVVNLLLKKTTPSANRKLNIRTYKVVPLSQCCGIVEWCEGTVPLGTYLIGTIENPMEGAHSRYRPKDWKNNDCRRKFASCKTKHQRMITYKDICENFKPVFAHFFMEYFIDPSIWYEHRLAYTRSLATSSIVGYIMGLGDRHIQNILIDKQTAELIHIDLGVAFEQGRTLPTPEVIPFRLTRDLVHGMGVSGVVGVFQRCSEETLSVMRKSQEELKTIVEVLLYDPLYTWTITPQKALNIQKSTDKNVSIGGTNEAESNKIAERVLIRVQEKLEGIENGIQLSIAGQVTHLINVATDSNNLCMLFQGWQPWI